MNESEKRELTHWYNWLKSKQEDTNNNYNFILHRISIMLNKGE